MSEELVLEEGDVTSAVLYILRNDSRLNDAHPGITIQSNRVGQVRLAKFVQVTRRGGVPERGSDRIMDRARIDVDCYAVTDSDTVDIAKKVRLAVYAAVGFEGYGLTITQVGREQGISEMPDEKTGDPRAFQTLALYVAANPDAIGPPA